jgi:plasmid stabilization system protein ParE
MAGRVAWSPRALGDLEAIAESIAADSPFYARAVVKKITDLARNLSRFPRAGRKVPELDDENIRELLAYSYRVICRVEGSELRVARSQSPRLSMAGASSGCEL